VDLNTGELRELEIYQPHHTKVAELSDEQYGGYMSLVQFGDISGILLGADRIELKAPAKATGMQDSLFCNDCRKMLKDNKCQGYILADLRNPSTPTVWQIKDGTSFSVRCYEIDITASDDREKPCSCGPNGCWQPEQSIRNSIRRTRQAYIPRKDNLLPTEK
jgi:hypothetical protein